MTLRETALRLFAKVYGLKTATTYLVKKQFPKFRASKKDHWEFLILKLLKIYRERKAESSQPTQEQILKMSDTELANYATSRGISAFQPRYNILQQLGIEVSNEMSPFAGYDDLSDSLTVRRGKYIPQARV